MKAWQKAVFLAVQITLAVLGALVIVARFGWGAGSPGLAILLSSGLIVLARSGRVKPKRTWTTFGFVALFASICLAGYFLFAGVISAFEMIIWSLCIIPVKLAKDIGVESSESTPEPDPCV